ncbi:MAG: hypothetical protein JXB33_01520 [Clostridia bacterium]|nr:hypothetical protein [Clostridia bacterium]
MKIFFCINDRGIETIGGPGSVGGVTKIAAGKSSWNVISDEKAAIKGGKRISVLFRLTGGELNRGSVSVVFRFCDWEMENYLMMPAAVYNGNRFRSVRIKYPPSIQKEHGGGVDMQATITDVPRLETDMVDSQINLLTNDLSTPAACIFYPKKKEGFIILMQNKTKEGYTGISFIENPVGKTGDLFISAPGMRRQAYAMCDRNGGEPDKGLHFPEGSEIRLEFILHSFECEDIGKLYEKFIDVRNDLLETGPRKINEMPLSEAFCRIEDKYNLLNWEKERRYYRVGISDGKFNSWQAGWVGGGMSPYCMLVDGQDISKRRSRETLDYIFDEMQMETGYFYSIEANGIIYGDDFGNLDNKYYVLLRKNADMAYFIFKQVMLLRKGSMDKVGEKYNAGLRAFCDALVRLWRRYGRMGQFIDIKKEEIILGGTAGSGIVPAVLSLAYRTFNDDGYLEAAEEIAWYYYNNFTLKGFTNGGPSEAAQCPDSESAFALLESYMVLYENTENKKWLEAAGDAANQALSWVVSYPFEFPCGSTFGERKINAVGSVFANVQNKHSAPGICTLSGDSLLKLYRATGKRRHIEAIAWMSRNMVQYLSTEENPIDSKGGGVLPPGCMCERVNMSDWEGRNRIGEVFNGSCWCEVSCMLSYNELPGIYFNKDTGELIELDNMIAKISDERGGCAELEIENPTKFDACIRILAESKDEAEVFLHQNRVAEIVPVKIRAGEKITVRV